MPEFMKCCDSCGDFLAHSQSDTVIGDRLPFASSPHQLRGFPGVKTITHSHTLRATVHTNDQSVLFVFKLKDIRMYKVRIRKDSLHEQQWNVFRTQCVLCTVPNLHFHFTSINVVFLDYNCFKCFDDHRFF